MRETCDRCRRPKSHCFCALVPSIETRTRVVVLQHPRERDVAIGTARMASLCLPNSELHVGLDWEETRALDRALSDPARPAALLYPGDGAVDLLTAPPDHPITLVVVDGTWDLTRKVVRRNPRLAALPRYAFNPPAPSDYRIRREPRAACVSTIEAMTYALGALERDPARFAAMLVPFRAMIDAQIAAEASHRRGRERRPRGPRPERPTPTSWLRGRSLVCVAAEANAWPKGDDGSPAPHPAEIVQWVACRVETGEAMEAFVAPAAPLAPGVAAQTGLSEARITGGETRDELLARWAAFARTGDVVCMWGEFPQALFEAAGGRFEEPPADLRRLLRAEWRGNVGSPRQCCERLGVSSEGALGAGRSGERLGELVAIARALIGSGGDTLGTRPSGPPRSPAGPRSTSPA